MVKSVFSAEKWLCLHGIQGPARHRQKLPGRDIEEPT